MNPGGDREGEALSKPGGPKLAGPAHQFGFPEGGRVALPRPGVPSVFVPPVKGRPSAQVGAPFVVQLLRRLARELLEEAFLVAAVARRG